MAELDEVLRVKVSLDGWQGGPGSNTFLFGDLQGSTGADSALAAATWVADYFAGVKAYLTDDVTYQVDPTVIKYDTASGNATEEYLVDLEDGSGVGLDDARSTNRACAVFISHYSAEYRDGRKVRGGAYLGPVGSLAIATDGTLDPFARTLIATQWLASAPGGGITHAVWHRPIKDKDGNVTEEGYAFSTVPPFNRSGAIAMLRSRRD